MAAGRKTLRRNRGMAETYAQMKRDAGHLDVKVTKITQTDWAITWTDIHALRAIERKQETK